MKKQDFKIKKDFHSEGAKRPKNRKSEEFYLDCHCEECNDEAIHRNSNGLPRSRWSLAMTFAFTLAEVLITLTIIGVIAALTIPNLMQKWQDHAEITAVKKAYSTIDNAIKMAVAENGPMEDWNWPDKDENSKYSNDNADFLAEQIRPYLKVQKICNHLQQGCWGYNAFNLLSGGKKEGYNADYNSGSNLVLQDGTRIKIGTLTLNYNYYNNRPGMYDTAVTVDTNGTKGPNRIGYDIFRFGISYTGLTPDNCVWNSRIANGCTITTENTWNGCSCYYWIWKHNNMDYKRRDVSGEW